MIVRVTGEVIEKGSPATVLVAVRVVLQKKGGEWLFEDAEVEQAKPGRGGQFTLESCQLSRSTADLTGPVSVPWRPHPFRAFCCQFRHCVRPVACKRLGMGIRLTSRNPKSPPAG